MHERDRRGSNFCSVLTNKSPKTGICFSLKETSLLGTRSSQKSASISSLMVILCKQVYDTQAEEAIAFYVSIIMQQQKPEF
jgi:hypothetical protein